MALSGTGEKQPDRKWCMQQFRTFNPIADIRHWVREREWQLKTTDRDQEKGTETTEHSMTYLRARGHICTDRSVFARHRHWHCVEWQHMEEHNMRQDRQWAQDKGLCLQEITKHDWIGWMDGWWDWPRGGEEGAVDPPKGGQSHWDGHDPWHHSQQLLTKRLGESKRVVNDSSSKRETEI